MLTPRSRCLLRNGVRAAAVITLIVLAAGSGVASRTAAAAPGARAARHAASAAQPPAPAGTGPLDAGQALARAQASGKPVTVGTLTTPTSLTTVGPAGEFTTTASLLPQRVLQNGSWVQVNPALQTAAGGRLVPAAVPGSVSLSGGGPGPLAELTSLGQTLSLALLATLPAPAVSGAAATYANVPVAGANLIVTVGDQGQVSTIVEVTSAAAAASPAIASLAFDAAGLTPSVDSSGNLAFTEDPQGAPVFAANAPRMWDSAPLPAGAPTVTDPASGTVLAAGSGLPAVSGISGPGAAAHVTSVPVTVAGQAVTLTPPAAALTGPGVTYPVFIDPTYQKSAPNENGSAWTQIDSGFPANTGNWMESGCLNGNGGPCLQTGFCDPTGPNMSSCGSLGITRTMIRLPLPANIPANATVATADLYFEDAWTAACNAQESQLWTTPGISSATDWTNSASQWTSDLEEESFTGYGSSCTTGYSTNDVVFGTDSGTKSGVSITGGSADNLASTIENDIHHSAATQTFGLRAANESTTACNWDGSECTGGTAVLQWRQWMNTAKSILLQFTWYSPPNKPSLGDTIGGACHTSSSNPAQIGNDAVTLYASGVGDSDGDTLLTTTIKVYTSGGTLKDTLTVPGTGKITAPQIARTAIQTWQANGTTTAYTYYYQATTTNQDYPADPTQISPVDGPCYFRYNPADPGPPLVTGYPDTVTFGDSYTVTFSPQQGLTCPGPSNCPASYSYQIGPGPVTTVSQSEPGAGTWNANGSWTGPVTVRQLGPVPLNVSSISTVGNPSTASTSPADSYLPAGAALPDGYFTGGSYPDVLFTGTGADPSLWLAHGTSNGKLAAPVDIGSLGNNVNGGSANDGPADWTGALILHGDFTGDDVQDVMAYWPAQTTIAGNTITPGHGMVLAGIGAGITMDPVQGAWAQTGPWEISAPQLCDYILDANCIFGDGLAEPSDLVAAGDLSEQGTPSPADLAGIVGYNGSYQLDLFTSGTPNGYGLDQTLSTKAPDGSSDWNNYVLASAELADTNSGSQQPQPDPENIALFAVNKTTGALYWSVNLSCQQGACTNTTLAGQDGTWQQISTTSATAWPTAWTGAQAAALVSADSQAGENGAGTGQPEVWIVTGNGTPTAAASYAITGTYPTGSLQAGTASSLAPASNDWPLTDGDPQVGGTATSPATATDILNATPTSAFGPSGNTCTWSQDPTFSTVLDTTGSPAQCYAAPPPATLPNTAAEPSISLWFNTTSHDGVLASIQAQALTGGSTSTGYYDPLLYIGNDGKLYGQWWTGTAEPISTSIPVDDGLWHHAQLTVTTSGGTTTQTLYLDGKQAGTLTGAIILPASATNLTLAAGYIGSAWPNENYQGQTGHLDYFNGQLAAAQVWDSVAPAQSTPPSVYVPVTPVRIMDTRSAYKIGTVTGPVAAHATITVPIAGNTTAGLPATGITAAAVAVTITNQTGAGNLIFYPDGTPQPVTSNLNFTASGGNITNDAIVPVGPDGKIAIYNASAGTDQIIVDLTGYFTTSTSTSTSNASTYTPLPDPTRILDTRVPTGVPTAGQIPGGGTLTLTIAGDNTNGAGIPSTGVTAIALNLTAVAPTGDSGFLVAYPDGISPPPGVTLLNYQGAANPNAGTVIITVPVGPDGKIDIYNASPTPTDLVGDLSGYFTTSTTGQYYHPLDSTRIIDTRHTSPLGANAAATIDSPPAITADNPTLVINLTATDETGRGDLQAYPSSAAQPISSILNYAAGVSIANLALVNTATSDSFIIRNQSSGTTDIIIDVNGYFQ